jgi:rhodanese-related sulfurtransferase
MSQSIDHAALADLLDGATPFALIDVREHGEYNLAHIPGASSVPRRQLELRMGRLVPFRGVQIVLCDDNGGRAALAARTLERMGYTRVAVLEGGVNRWASADRPTEWGMNVPSKDFGEKVEVQHHVPTIDAVELERRQRQGESLLIVDTRTPEEYRRFCIPGGRSAPGGELALRIHDLLRERPGATVVVNCAGRTRSIIGARALQRMALPNVVSLKNGTSGWLLAGFELERNADRVELPAPSAEGRAAAEAFAARIAAEDGVRPLSIPELDALMARASDETVYLIDVRTREEYAAGHIPGFAWFPGGQAVQRSDDTVAVRRAAVVFCCDGTARSSITASWYRQMGYPNVYAVTGGTTAWSAAGRPLATGAGEPTEPLVAEGESRARRITSGELAARLTSPEPPLVVHVETSDRFAAGHIPAARWISRSWLELRIAEHAPDKSRPIVIADDDGGADATLAAATLTDMGYENVAALSGGMATWRREGRPIETGLTGVMRPPDDVVPAGPDRTYADMINYLRWEEQLGRKYAP